MPLQGISDRVRRARHFLGGRAHLFGAGCQLFCRCSDLTRTGVDIPQQRAKARCHVAHRLGERSDLVVGREGELFTEPAASDRLGVRRDRLDALGESAREPYRERHGHDERDERVGREPHELIAQHGEEPVRLECRHHEAGGGSIGAQHRSSGGEHLSFVGVVHRGESRLIRGDARGELDRWSPATGVLRRARVPRGVDEIAIAAIRIPAYDRDAVPELAQVAVVRSPQAAQR